MNCAQQMNEKRQQKQSIARIRVTKQPASQAASSNMPNMYVQNVVNQCKHLLGYRCLSCLLSSSSYEKTVSPFLFLSVFFSSSSSDTHRSLPIPRGAYGSFYLALFWRALPFDGGQHVMWLLYSCVFRHFFSLLQSLVNLYDSTIATDITFSFA